MADFTLSIDFGNGFSVRTSDLESSGSFHRLTPEQFDALVDTFQVTSDVRTLTTDGRYTPPRNFRTAEINLGGLDLTIFSDIPSHVDPDQLSLL